MSVSHFPAKLPAAPGICEECLADRTITKIKGTFLVSHCRHNQTGGYMLIIGGNISGKWNLYTPATADEWSRIMDEAIAIATASIKKNMSLGIDNGLKH